MWTKQILTQTLERPKDQKNYDSMDIYDCFTLLSLGVFLPLLHSIITSLTVCGRGVTVNRGHDSINVSEKSITKKQIFIPV